MSFSFINLLYLTCTITSLLSLFKSKVTSNLRLKNHNKNKIIANSITPITTIITFFLFFSSEVLTSFFSSFFVISSFFDII